MVVAGDVEKQEVLKWLQHLLNKPESAANVDTETDRQADREAQLNNKD